MLYTSKYGICFSNIEVLHRLTYQIRDLIATFREQCWGLVTRTLLGTDVERTEYRKAQRKSFEVTSQNVGYASSTQQKVQ